jgi:hypothetical protein
MRTSSPLLFAAPVLVLVGLSSCDPPPDQVESLARAQIKEENRCTGSGSGPNDVTSEFLTKCLLWGSKDPTVKDVSTVCGSDGRSKCCKTFKDGTALCVWDPPARPDHQGADTEPVLPGSDRLDGYQGPALPPQDVPGTGTLAPR